MAALPVPEARPRGAFTRPEDIRQAYRQFDIVIAALLFFLFMALYHVFWMLSVGDWDFWTDWKDRQWWVFLTPVVSIAMPAAAQYIFWEKFRLPFAGTLLAVCLVVATWINRVMNMSGWAYFPLNFVWPVSMIASGIALDATLVLTRSYLLMSIFGGFFWALLFYLANWPLMAAFSLPVDVDGVLMSIADVQGYHYIRTGTPEYLRLIDRGTLRSFGQEPAYVSVAVAMFLSAVVCFVFVMIGRAFTKTQFSWLKRI
jgi:methane/ammonia monooxygenase subunit A